RKHRRDPIQFDLRFQRWLRPPDTTRCGKCPLLAGNAFPAIKLSKTARDPCVDCLLVFGEPLGFGGLRGKGVVDELFDTRKRAAVETLLDELLVLRRESNGRVFKLR